MKRNFIHHPPPPPLPQTKKKKNSISLGKKEAEGMLYAFGQFCYNNLHCVLQWFVKVLFPSMTMDCSKTWSYMVSWSPPYFQSWSHTQVIASMDSLWEQWWFSWCYGSAAHSKGYAVQARVTLSQELWSCRFPFEHKCKERCLWPYDSVFQVMGKV